MHEISLCESILDILKEQSVRDDYTTVKRVALDIGVLSCVEPEALRFGFDAVMKGSLAEGAVLEIVRTDGEAICLTCFKTVSVQDRFAACPACGAQTLQVTRGEELKIREVEVL